MLSLRHTLQLQDTSGRPLASIKQKLVTFTDAMEIEHDGQVVATVHRSVFSPLHHRAAIDLADGGRLEASGNIIGKDFEIRDGHQVVAQVSRAWFRVRDTYGVDVAPGEDAALMIASRSASTASTPTRRPAVGNQSRPAARERAGRVP